MKASLSSKRKNVAVILGSKKIPLPNTHDKAWYYEQLKQWCADHTCEYSFIMHERDLQEDGSPKWPHIHMALIMKSVGKGRNYPSLNTILNSLAKQCEVDGLSIQIDEMTSEVGSVQYLIHKRNQDKAHYLESEVISSYPQEELHTIMESDDEGALSVTYLVSVCSQCRNRIEIMEKIGLKAYKDYRLVITDILTDLKAKKWRSLICDGVINNA